MPFTANLSRLSLRLAAGVVAVAVASWAGTATAQNDWQYPDPYFGILEIEKSHGGSVARRPRPELSSSPRPKPTWSRPGLFRARRPSTTPRQR